MSVLKKYFDKSCNQASPVQFDLARVVKYDSDGNEVVEWLEVDYPTIQKSHGACIDWTLDSLMKAGINPDFPISTGYCTRLAGLGVFQSILSEVESVNVE